MNRSYMLYSVYGCADRSTNHTKQGQKFSKTFLISTKKCNFVNRKLTMILLRMRVQIMYKTIEGYHSSFILRKYTTPNLHCKVYLIKFGFSNAITCLNHILLWYIFIFVFWYFNIFIPCQINTQENTVRQIINIWNYILLAVTKKEYTNSVFIDITKDNK